jgi:hypothetical protein
MSKESIFGNLELVLLRASQSLGVLAVVLVGHGSLALAGEVSSVGNSGTPGMSASSELVRPMGRRSKVMPWEDPKRETCGFECLYQRANEVMGLEAKYMVRKLVALEDLVSRKKPDADNSEIDAQLRGSLGKFCELTSTQSDIDQCFVLFKKMGVFALRKVQSAMTKNYDSAAMISNARGSKGLWKMSYWDHRINSGKKKQSPHIITFEDLERRYPSLETLQILGTNSYQRWAEGLPFEPSPDDFVKFEERPKDPLNPAAGTLLVIARDKKGNIKRDMVAYEAAKKKYLAIMTAEKGRFAQIGNAMERDLRRPGSLASSAGSFNKKLFSESSKVRIESSIPANGKPQISSQGVFNYEKQSKDPQRIPGSEALGKGGNSTESRNAWEHNGKVATASIGKSQTKQMTDEDFERNGTSYLYYSPREIGKVVDKLESDL